MVNGKDNVQDKQDVLDMSLVGVRGLELKCDKCHEIFNGKHRAWCKECNKPHPICDNCYKQGINEGTLVKNDRHINDKPSIEQVNKWI